MSSRRLFIPRSSDARMAEISDTCRDLTDARTAMVLHVTMPQGPLVPIPSFGRALATQ